MSGLGLAIAVSLAGAALVLATAWRQPDRAPYWLECVKLLVAFLLRLFDPHDQLHAGANDFLNPCELTIQAVHAQFSPVHPRLGPIHASVGPLHPHFGLRLEMQDMLDGSLDVHASF